MDMKQAFRLGNSLLLLLFILLTSVCNAATYYVDKDSVGGTCSDSNSGTSTSSPWCTIGKANTTVSAGDNVWIVAGTYNEYISPGSSGTSGNLIKYENYNSGVVTLANQDVVVNIGSHDYIHVKGINATNVDERFVYINGGDYNIVEDCDMVGDGGYATWVAVYLRNEATYNQIINNKMGYIGEYTSDDDLGDMIYIGTQYTSGGPDGSSYNLIQGNEFYSGAHTLLAVFDPYNVVKNNYFHNEEWFVLGAKIYGNRDAYIHSTGWCLFEGNRFGETGIPSDQDYASGLVVGGSNNIVRRNFFYANKGPGIKLGIYSSNAYDADDNRIYNNNFFYNGYDTIKTQMQYWISIIDWRNGEDVDGNVITNNIAYSNNNNNSVGFYSGTAYTVLSYLANQTIENNYTGNPLWTSADAGSFDVDDVDYPDFNLLEGSPCINNGDWLTTVSGSGSGTSFTVDDASYFMDGWGIITGDQIQLEGSSTVLTITDITGNTITFTPSTSWTNGDGVSLAYYGSAPDQGAIEFGDSSDTTSPSVSGRSPAPSSVGVSTTADITFYISDGESGVDISTLVVTEEGNSHTTSTDLDYSGSDSIYYITLGNRSYAEGQVVNVTIDADDNDGNTMSQVSYSYTCAVEGDTEIEPDSIDGNIELIFEDTGNADIYLIQD